MGPRGDSHRPGPQPAGEVSSGSPAPAVQSQPQPPPPPAPQPWPGGGRRAGRGSGARRRSREAARGRLPWGDRHLPLDQQRRRPRHQFRHDAVRRHPARQRVGNAALRAVVAPLDSRGRRVHEARFNRLAGYFEMDFSGATPGNIAVSSSSAGFRLRQAFTEVLYGDRFVFAAGQAFSLMTPPRQQLSIWPSDYELSQAVDTNYVVGLVWDRAPQVRFTWRFSPRVNWAVSVENPEQQIGSEWVTLPACCSDDIAAQYNTGEQALAVPNLMPDFATRVAWNPTPALHLDAGGVLRVFRHTVAPKDRDFKETGGGLSVNGRVNPARGTRVIGQFASGAGLGRYVGGLAPDVAFRQDGSIAPVRSRSWVLGVEQGLSPRVSTAGYYSGLEIEDTFFADLDGGLIGYGFPGSSNAANRRIREATATMSYQVVRTENRGSAQVNVQASWLRREPWSAGTGPYDARGFLFFAQVRYNLP